MLLLLLLLNADASATSQLLQGHPGFQLSTVDVPSFSGSPALGNVALGGQANSLPPWRMVVMLMFG